MRWRIHAAVGTDTLTPESSVMGDGRKMWDWIESQPVEGCPEIALHTFELEELNFCCYGGGCPPDSLGTRMADVAQVVREAFWAGRNSWKMVPDEDLPDWENDEMREKVRALLDDVRAENIDTFQLFSSLEKLVGKETE